jgi:hypothetical protein
MASWTQKIRAHSASKQPKPRKPPAVVFSTLAQTRYPNEETGDPGAVMDVFYTFDGNEVTLTDAKGKPLGGKAQTYILQPGDNAVRIATRLALAGRGRASHAPSEVAWVI